MKILIIGISGYIGDMLLRKLSEDDRVKEITGIDIKSPKNKSKKLNFIKGDIRDSRIWDYFPGTDILFHLAFIVEPLPDKKLIYDININGSKNVLWGCEKHKVPKIIIASSTAAYGVQPASAGIITEITPLLADKSSYYGHTKKIVEEYLDDYEKVNPEKIIIRLRPSILLGKNNRNFAGDFMRMPFIPDFTGREVSYPFIHEDDAVEAFYKAIDLQHSGKYIISLPEGISAKKLGQILNKRVLKLPVKFAIFLSEFLYKIGLTKFSSDWVVLLQTDWKFDIKAAKEDLKWEPIHDAEDIFNQRV